MLNNNCQCLGTCQCYLPSLSRVVKAPTRPRIDPNIIASMLVQTIACNNSDLSQHLSKLAPIIVRRNGFCSDELFYISAQIELTDAAMMFARNYVDFSDSRATSRSMQQARSRSESEGKAQSTSQGASCGFSDSYSENQFNRESYDRSRSNSTTDSESNGRSDSNTYDRSLQQASGISQVWDTALSETTGEGVGSHDEFTVSSGMSYTKRGDQFPGYINDIDPGNAIFTDIFSVFSDVNAIWWQAETIGTFEAPSAAGGSGEFDFHLFEQPPLGPGDRANFGDRVFDSIDDNYNDPGAQPITNDNLPDLICCCDNYIGLVNCDVLTPARECHWDNETVYDSVGQRFSADYKVNIGLDVIKKGLSATINWAVGGSWNQSHIVTKACTSGQSNSDTSNFYTQVDTSRAHGESLTHDISNTQRDYHVRADSERTAHSRTDAGSATTGDAESQSESNAERISHNESRGSSQGTNWSKSRSRSNSLSTSDSKSESIAKNLSDIFTALSKMYDILVEQRQLYRARFVANQGASIGIIESCKYAIPSDPVISAMLRSLASCWEKQISI